MQSRDECWCQHSKLIQVILGQVGEHGLAPLRDAEPNGAPIFRTAIAHDESRLDKAIDELHHGVMANA